MDDETVHRLLEWAYGNTVGKGRAPDSLDFRASHVSSQFGITTAEANSLLLHAKARGYLDQFRNWNPAYFLSEYGIVELDRRRGEGKRRMKQRVYDWIVAEVRKKATERRPFNMWWFGAEGAAKAVGCTVDDAAMALAALEGEGLLAVHPSVQLGHTPRTYALSPRGYGGDSSSSPSPQHLTFNAPVASVQTGAGASVTVTQNIGTQAEELLALVADMRKHAVEQSAPDTALDDLDTVEEQLHSATPNEGRLVRALRRLKGFAEEGADWAIRVHFVMERLGMS